MRRSRGYSKVDWQAIQEEGERKEARIAEPLAAGADPEGEDAMVGAEVLRQHIDG